MNESVQVRLEIIKLLLAERRSRLELRSGATAYPVQATPEDPDNVLIERANRLAVYVFQGTDPGAATKDSGAKAAS